MDLILGTILPFLIILTVLVFVHELGHFWVARRAGVRVEVFSVGFGPEIFGWTAASGTRWKFSAIPLGGYVKMFGDSDPSSSGSVDTEEWTEEERRVAFHSKPLKWRSAIVAAGPIANFLLAIVLLAGLYLEEGRPYAPAVVESVTEGSAAAKAGLMVDDEITAIDGAEITSFQDLRQIVTESAGVELIMTVRRDGALFEVAVTPDTVTQTDRFGYEHRFGRLGIRSNKMVTQELGLSGSLMAAFDETGTMVRQTLSAVGQIIVGSRGAEELGGPIRIAQMSGAVVELGLATTIWFMAVLSVNLGLINLFPIPVLDGGHLLLYAIEAVRGRPLGEKAQEYFSMTGLGLVLLLMVFVTFNDLAQLSVFENLSALLG